MHLGSSIIEALFNRRNGFNWWCRLKFGDKKFANYFLWRRFDLLATLAELTIAASFSSSSSSSSSSVFSLARRLSEIWKWIRPTVWLVKMCHVTFNSHKMLYFSNFRTLASVVSIWESFLEDFPKFRNWKTSFFFVCNFTKNYSI